MAMPAAKLDSEASSVKPYRLPLLHYRLPLPLVYLWTRFRRLAADFRGL
jgi:hypothetical protein